jgi:hypothetical protein
MLEPATDVLAMTRPVPAALVQTMPSKFIYFRRLTVVVLTDTIVVLPAATAENV